MNVLIAPIGTFGDVAPVISHAHNLKKNGDNIHFVITSDFVELVKHEGFSFTEILFDFKEFTNQNISVIGKPLKAMFNFKKDLTNLVDMSFDCLKGIISEYDYLIGSGLQFAAYNLAESNKITYQHFIYAPVWLPSAYHTPPFLKKQYTTHAINKFLWSAFMFFINRLLKENINKKRKGIGLSPLKNVYTNFQNNVTLSCDSDLISSPGDTVYSNQTQYLFIINEDKLPENLISFLSTPNDIVYIGFGSMPLQNSNDVLTIIEKICKDMNIRVVFQANEQADITNSNTPWIYILKDKVSHKELFKKVKLVIHHGGAGTVHQAFRAQTPQLIIPFMLDQYYWASVVSKKRIGVEPLFLNQLNYKNLSKRILAGLKKQ